MDPDSDYYFIQVGASSHTSKLCQNFLQATIYRIFINKNDWAPKSPDLNVLGYYFWNTVEEGIYNSSKEPFQGTDQL